MDKKNEAKQEYINKKKQLKEKMEKISNENNLLAHIGKG